MDIRDNKTSRQSNIKNFALKATASTILTLSAETAIATSPCPTQIYGDTLAGIICNFSTTSSVTVENGGTVGGLFMSAYQPTNSSITIDAGGVVTNTTDIGINIQSSSLTNGLSNSGTINTTSASAISISNASTISNGLSNSGIISSLGGSAISIASSTIHGTISNSGSISHGGNDEGIAILNSLINGNINNSGGSIDSNSGNAIFIRSSTVAGNISNSGTVSGHSAGLFISNGTTVAGSLSNNGTISSDSTGLSIRSAVNINGNIANTGTISGGTDGITIFSSTISNDGISNSGTISGGTYGINISSSSTLNGGISNSGTIQGDVSAIRISNSSVNNIDILGKTARMIGGIEAAETAINITTGALFTSEGHYTVRQFNIEQNAVFNLANSITVANTLNNTGTLAVADGLQTIIGDYTQNTGGLFQTDVSSGTNYGQLSVTGTADLSQSGSIYVQINQNSSLHAGEVLSNVISGDTFLTPTSGFNINDNSFIWNFNAALNNTNNGVNLTAGINPVAYTVCQGTYCQGAANTIIGQIAAGNPVFNPYAALPTANALQVAASQATPELTNENIQLIQLITRAVVDIVPMWSSLRGKSSGDAMFYQPGKIWVKPYGASMTQNERHTVNGFDATAYGTVIGKDIELSHHWLFGGAFAAGGDNMHGKSVLSGQSINSNAYQGMLYGAKKLPNQVYFAGQGLVGYETNNTHRSIPLYGSTATGSYHSWFTNIRAETGWSTHAFSPDFIFTPEIDASYLFINQGSYRETGSPMDLSVASNHNTSLVLGAYGNGAYHLVTMNNQYDLTLTGYAGVAGDVINSQPQTISTFVAGGASFSTFGVQFNGAVFRGGAGLTIANQAKPLSFELTYDLQAGNNAYSGIGAATLKYKL